MTLFRRGRMTRPGSCSPCCDASAIIERAATGDRVNDGKHADDLPCGVPLYGGGSRGGAISRPPPKWMYVAIVEEWVKVKLCPVACPWPSWGRGSGPSGGLGAWPWNGSLS